MRRLPALLLLVLLTACGGSRQATPPTGPEDKDPHDSVRVLDAAYSQTNDWLRTGMIVPYCTDKCDPE